MSSFPKDSCPSLLISVIALAVAPSMGKEEAGQGSDHFYTKIISVAAHSFLKAFVELKTSTMPIPSLCCELWTESCQCLKMV